MSAAVTPQAVSRALRRAGFLPVPRTREGLHVTRSWNGASVVADLPDRDKYDAAEAAAVALRAAGYDARRIGNRVSVSGRLS